MIDQYETKSSELCKGLPAVYGKSACLAALREKFAADAVCSAELHRFALEIYVMIVR